MQTQIKTGLLNRWHLYDGTENRFTVIPSEKQVKIVGRFNDGWGLHEKRTETLTYKSYEDFINDNGFKEVRP